MANKLVRLVYENTSTCYSPIKYGLRRKLTAMNKSTQDEQAVLIYLDGQNLPDEVYEQYDVLTLESYITDALEKAGTGEYDGEEYGPTEALLHES